MRILTFILIAIALSACNKANEKSHLEVKHTKTEPTFDLPKSEYAILPFDTAWYWIFKEAEQLELTNVELCEIEEIIELAVNENNNLQENVLTKHNKTYPDDQWTETGYELDLKTFKRQYISVTNNRGEKEIWINFFCDNMVSKNWESDILMVHDGGNCFFNLKVNLTNKTYSELRINGYA